MVDHVELIGVPFDGYGRAGNQAAASEALRVAGLASAFGSLEVTDRGDLELPAPDPNRGAVTSLMNEAALLAMVERVGEAVTRAVENGRFPVVHGGDCSTLLGVIPALRRTRSVALLFLDGHEDTMPLDVSEDGEAANTEIGLLLGLTGHLLKGPLASRVGVLHRRDIAVLGPRDEAWRRRFNVGSLQDHGVWFSGWQQTSARPQESAQKAVRHIRAAAEHWWLHVDLDVLDPKVFAAQGVPGAPGEPNGLSWEALTSVLTTAVGEGGCVGCSVAIYDPVQDPSRADALRIVRLVNEVVSVIA